MSFENMIVARPDRCSICNGSVSELISLPRLPITDSYCREPVANPISGIDQSLLYCENCGHAQLGNLISPSVLYGSNYCFRTSASATARSGTDLFLSVLDEAAPGRRFQCALDIGCNDLHLLRLLSDRAVHRVGVDPVWKGSEDQCEGKSILVVGRNFEDVTAADLPAKPDLILCRHTLEHIHEPRKMIETIFEIAADGAIFLFEVPSLEVLVKRLRFDQVFHQHAQYFSLHSFLNMLDYTGGQLLLSQLNYHNWGALIVAFERRGAGVASSGTVPKPSFVDIQKRYEMFKSQMINAGAALAAYAGDLIYGYGAAQMLPVLGYHMGTDFSELNFVLDDDPNKDGMGYWNLPVRIKLASSIENIADATVLITAIDNVQPIMAKLLTRRPRHILYPLNVI